jgi:phage tail sheath protein FI
MNKAVLCSSFDEYQATFGGLTATSDLALAAMGYFENGGSALWAVRVAQTGGTAATGTMLFSGDPLMDVTALQTGTDGNRLSVNLELGTSGSYNVVVLLDDIEVERFNAVTLDSGDERFVDTVVNDSSTGSELVSVEYAPGTEVSVTSAQSVDLTGGVNGSGAADADLIGNESTKTGLHALDNVQDLSLLIVPGRATSAVHNAMLAYCEVFRDGKVFAIMDPPAGVGAADMVTYVSTTASLENASEYGAIYWPRVTIANPQKAAFGADATIVVPPSGIIAGVYARTDAARPGGVYDPPAGIEAGRLFKVLGFDNDETLNERKRDIVYPHRINPLTTAPGLPKYIDGSRTLKGSGAFPFIAERRGVIFIEKSLQQGLQFARHKNNTPELRAQVRRTIVAFLLNQMKNGAFASNDPSKAFFVDVSDALNTPSVIAAGKLIARVGLATNKPAEYIILQISQDTRALEEELAAAG